MTDETLHYNISGLTHNQIRGVLKARGVTFDNLVTDGKPDYKVSHCCAVHCEEVYIYTGQNPGYCTKCIQIMKNHRNRPQGVPYGKSKL
jgi:hypothetical protein